MNQTKMELRTVNVTRYVTPLREGGSMPAIVEADDGFLYVIKFRGAGQGTNALIADLIGGELARALGLQVPELVFMNLAEGFGRSEGDEEIQDLLKFSVGLNLGVHYLSGAITYDATVTTLDPLLASKILWLDCLLINIDRTHRNTNMLMWKKELWMIDPGASLYFHHNWSNWREHIKTPFALVQNHVLLKQASKLEEADEFAKNILIKEVIEEIVSLIPDDFLNDESLFETKDEYRNAYATFLMERIKHSDIFIKEAQNAQQKLI
ncbi:HipA family kinase [Fulvivirga sp.]|uniref:HipA family kinase n=1 Tax=Fulvivirga sp. TaxID=1931237 RepID=UPI0032ED069B